MVRGFRRLFNLHPDHYEASNLWGRPGIENAAMKDRTVIEWNKDDIDSLGILKVDCLSLGMLTACLERNAASASEEIVDAVYRYATGFPAGNREDDFTLLVFRQE